ncbi:unnamed protein product, partial [Prorocentrum cordatum]
DNYSSRQLQISTECRLKCQAKLAKQLQRATEYRDDVLRKLGDNTVELSDAKKSLAEAQAAVGGASDERSKNIEKPDEDEEFPTLSRDETALLDADQKKKKNETIQGEFQKEHKIQKYQEEKQVKHNITKHDLKHLELQNLKWPWLPNMTSPTLTRSSSTWHSWRGSKRERAQHPRHAYQAPRRQRQHHRQRQSQRDPNHKQLKIKSESNCSQTLYYDIHNISGLAQRGMSLILPKVQ